VRHDWAEFRDGWHELTAAFVGNAFGAGTLAFYTFGVFAPELARSFGWGRGQLATGLLINTVAAMLVSPVVGSLADRYGARPVALVSTFALGPVLMCFALMHGSIVTYYVVWACVATLGAGTFPMIWSRPVNARFHVHKGLALGAGMVGTGAAGALLKPFAFAIIERWGWRPAYVAVGLLPWVSFAVAYFLLRGRSRPPVEVGSPAMHTKADLIPPGISLTQSFRQWRFWMLVIAMFVSSLGISGPFASMESVLRAKGFTAGESINLAQLLGLSSVIGRVASGFLVDRIWAPLVGTAFLLSAAVACAVFGLTSLQPALAATAVLLIGLASGMESDLVAFLVARYFGPRHFSSIYGFLFAAWVIGVGLGSVLFGAAFDRTRSYDSAFGIFAFVLIASALCLLTLGKYRFPSPAMYTPVMK
jgi:predicted MFS family arabinose efflux permease